MPLGSVFALIKIWAGWGSWQDNSGIQVSKHNLRPELCSWHHWSAGLLSRKSSHRDGQRCRWNTIPDGRRVLLHSQRSPAVVSPHWGAMLNQLWGCECFGCEMMVRAGFLLMLLHKGFWVKQKSATASSSLLSLSADVSLLSQPQ